MPNAVPDDRNYAAFALLAGVRDYGENGDRRIADPRGLPDGVDNEDDVFGDHSFSWVLLSEVIGIMTGDYWESGLVSTKDAAKVDAGGTPDEWYQGTSDRTCVERRWKRPIGRSAWLLSEWIAAFAKYEPSEIRFIFGFDN